jgi:hypothetical protein
MNDVDDVWWCRTPKNSVVYGSVERRIRGQRRIALQGRQLIYGGQRCKLRHSELSELRSQGTARNPNRGLFGIPAKFTKSVGVYVSVEFHGIAGNIFVYFQICMSLEMG